MRRHVAAVALLATGCGAAAVSPEPPEPTPVASVPPATSIAPAPVASSAPAPAPPSPTAELEAEIARVRQCPLGSTTSYDLRCAANEAFTRARATPQTVAEEDLLLSLARGPQPMRLSALFRLSKQPGPRTTDPARALAVLDLARAVDLRDHAEMLWLGRVVGAVTLETAEVREAMRALVATHVNEMLAGDIVTGIGVAHPHEPAALDLVDAFVPDTRVFVQHGVADAYAETALRDDARACATWAKLLGNEAMVVRAAALLSVTRGCAAHHPALLALAEKRLAKDPEDRTMIVLPHLCEGPQKAALGPRVTALATKLLAKHGPNDWGDDLRAIGACDPRGPVAALRPIARQPGERGFAAKRVLLDLVGHE